MAMDRKMPEGRGCNAHEGGGGGGGGCCPSFVPPNAKSDARTSRRSQGRCIDQRFRDYLVRTNVDLLTIGLALAWYHAGAAYAESAEGEGSDAHGGCGGDGEHTEEVILAEESREAYAVLFPWFAEIVGVFVYYFLSRYVHAIPYTAVMFIVGALIGLSIQRTNVNGITFSAYTWTGIEGEVILLVFLPGLLYLDSYNIDVHLFFASFSQLLTFAFPMVLAGTALTALVAFYVFNYGWSFDLCMTFGSILAATDPVAVAVLLNELGAPPRLKMHVSGESLMNDGSAVVFYHIFSLRYLYEIGLPDVGEDVGWGEGFRLFFRLSLGGCCIGIAFGVGLLIVLYNLNRRLSGEDAVVQVVATVTVAYLAFFTSEILASCSGIIAVVFCGVTTKAFGETLYNDSHLSTHFWEITEYLLNTLLFTLGGCVWGDILSGRPGVEGTELLFTASDWGYLFALFILITIIRFFLVFSFYPITSRIGIGSNWREAVFMSYGGLRGAVGIALALSLQAEVYHATSADEVSEDMRNKFRLEAAKLFGMVGGIALLTLVINGPTSGPLLRRLGLVTPSETRKKVIENYRQHMVQYTLGEYVALLTEPRFHDMDFTVIKDHVPFLSDITYEELMSAVKKHEDMSPSSSYVRPNLMNVIPYLYQSERNISAKGYDNGQSQSPRPFRRSEMMKHRRSSARDIRKSHGDRQTVFDLRQRYDEADVQEERLVFLKILRSAYFRLIEHGELQARGFIFQSLSQSLDFTEDAASRGLPMSDWNALEVASDSWARPAERLVHKFFNLSQRIKRKKYLPNLDLDFFLINLKVRQILAFIHAHQHTRKIFKQEFSKAGEGCLTAAEKIVLDECDQQVELADAELAKLDEDEVTLVKSHYACQILLNRSAFYFKKLRKHGLMSEREAGEFLELIEEYIYDALECQLLEHKDEMSTHHKRERLTQFSPELLSSWNLLDEVSKKNVQETDGDEEEDAQGGLYVEEAALVVPTEMELLAMSVQMTTSEDEERPT